MHTSFPHLRCKATHFAVAATYRVLIGRSHGELGRFTAHSLPLSSAEMKPDEIRWATYSSSVRMVSLNK